jgi:hypothetical protein
MRQIKQGKRPNFYLDERVFMKLSCSRLGAAVIG